MPKTIFNTTEKSNFILNMKEETVDRLSLFVLSGICIIMTLSQIPAEFSYAFTDMPFLALGVSGVLVVVTGIILMLRKHMVKNNIAGLAIMFFLFLWSMISYYNSYNLTTSLWGQDGRYDGLVTMIICIFLFISASMISDGKIQKLFDIMTGAGLFQCLWAVYQLFPFGKSYYRNLESIAEKNVCLTSGLCGNPFFFAMLMSVLLAISVFGTVFGSDRRHRIYYGISSVVFTLAALQTHTVSAVTAVVFIYAVSLAVTAVKHKFNKISIMMFILATAAAAVELIAGYKFYDGGIAWQDSFYRLGVTGYYSFTHSDFDVNNLKEVYSYFWNEAVEAIKDFPLAGTGIDCFSYTQYKTSNVLQYEINSIDRPYNDYLFLAATRGIPYLAGYLTMLVYTLVNSIKTAAKNNEWYYKAMPFAVIVFMIVSIFNNSSVSVMPFIWIILGLSAKNRKNNGQT